MGEFKTLHSLLANRHPLKDIVDPSKNNEVIVKNIPNNVPDQILLQGLLATSNAPISLHFRGGKPFPATPGVEWRVQGENGELRLTSPTMSLNVGNPATKLEFYDAANGTVEVLEGVKDEWEELPLPAQNIGRAYEAYRKGEWYPDFKWGVKRHEIIQKVWEKYDQDLSEE